MLNKNRSKLTLYQPAHYQIKVPGLLEALWPDWGGEMTIRVEANEDGQPISILSGRLDQAALHGLLRRLYSLGLPLISVIWINSG